MYIIILPALYSRLFDDYADLLLYPYRSQNRCNLLLQGHTKTLDLTKQGIKSGSPIFDMQQANHSNQCVLGQLQCSFKQKI